jgi:hypothetical protein
MKRKGYHIMKALEEFLAEKREITIHTVASYARQYLREQWHVVFQEHEEKLLQMYATAGEPTYGYYSRLLFRPLHEQLKREGFIGDAVCQIRLDYSTR